MFVDKFAENLKRLREERGATQKEVADYIGVGVQSYQRYEYRTREPGIEQLARIADFFDVSVDYLIGRTDKPN